MSVELMSMSPSHHKTVVFSISNRCILFIPSSNSWHIVQDQPNFNRTPSISCSDVLRELSEKQRTLASTPAWLYMIVLLQNCSINWPVLLYFSLCSFVLIFLSVLKFESIIHVCALIFLHLFCTSVYCKYSSYGGNSYISLCKKLYYYCFDVVGSRNEFERDLNNKNIAGFKSD